MCGVTWWPKFMLDLDVRWKWEFVTDEPQLPGTDESLINWMLAPNNMSDDVKELYPGICAVQIHLGEHKSTPLPAVSGESSGGTLARRPPGCKCAAISHHS